MAGGFSVLNALNKNTRQQAEDRPAARFRTKDINIADIYANSANFYIMQDVEVLAEDIKAVGLLENLVVTYAPQDGKNYRLIGGERRWRALQSLVEQGYNEFAVTTCNIRAADTPRAEMVEIIMCNRQRVKTVWEQIEEERRLKEALQEMKQNGETLKGYNLQEGRLRDTIAAILSYSAAKVGQMETITAHLLPEFKEALAGDKINFSTAYTLAKMPDDQQRAALDAYTDAGTINSAEARRAAATATSAEPEEPEPIEYGLEQEHIEPLCYRCLHWKECCEKSETTIKCATFEDKATKPQPEAPAQVQIVQQANDNPKEEDADKMSGDLLRAGAAADMGQDEDPEESTEKWDDAPKMTAPSGTADPEQAANVELLRRLIAENPTLPVIPVVHADVFGFNFTDHSAGAWSEPSVSRVCLMGTDCVFYGNDEPRDILADLIPAETLDSMTEEQLKTKYDALPWINAVIAYIAPIQEV